MKTDWNKLLEAFRGKRKKDFPTLVSYCIAEEKKGVSVEDILSYVSSNEVPVTRLASTPGPYAIFGSDIESGAYEQMNTVARLPVFVRGALMADAHPGYGMPIGGVAALLEAVAPYLVGVDMGCRVTALFFCMSGLLMTDKERNGIEAAIVGMSRFGLAKLNETHPLMRAIVWDKIEQLKNVRDLAESQLGTSGGGNHFIDLMETDIAYGGKRLYAIMLHSGSRGAGAKLAKHYSLQAKQQCEENNIVVPNNYEWLDYRSNLGREYFSVMSTMCSYSRANHEVILGRILNAIDESGIEIWQTEPFLGTKMSVAVADKKHGKVDLRYITNPHNLASIEPVGDQNLIVHRKGATPAHAGSVGIIPGSSGSNSYIVIGRGNADSLNSASHGAGRPHSRTEAKAKHDKEAWLKHMEDRGIHYVGVAPDETVYAYKDIDKVMAAQIALVDLAATMRPLLVVMGGKSDDGD